MATAAGHVAGEMRDALCRAGECWVSTVTIFVRPSIRRSSICSLTTSPKSRWASSLGREEEHGYVRAKSAVYELVSRLRPVPVARWRLEGIAGEFSQHDFEWIEVRYTANPSRVTVCKHGRG